MWSTVYNGLLRLTLSKNVKLVTLTVDVLGIIIIKENTSVIDDTGRLFTTESRLGAVRKEME